MIEGKVFCDLGCGAGVVMIGAKKYARQVIGIERNEERRNDAVAKGLNVTGGDVLTMAIPNADVYYAWIDHRTQRALHARWYKGEIKGTYIIGAESHVPEEMAVFDELCPDDVIEWAYNEGTGHREAGTFKLGVFYARGNL